MVEQHIPLENTQINDNVQVSPNPQGVNKTYEQSTTDNTVEDESYKFFKGFKKNHKIPIELKFDEYIADPEFLKLMMNNFESDVIMYYTKMIYNNILMDSDQLKDMIYKQLENFIMKKKSVRKPRTVKKPMKKTKTISKKDEKI